ncbi:MAG: D-alanine--D-alanine ligase, partial [Alphaproteobacteria bacterium CG11_big_fil_rev_8_21_14_0_20_44_7]
AEGSSVGVSIIKSVEDLKKAKTEWHFGRAMVEKYIPGKELSVAVLESPEPNALGVIELRPKVEFYDYKAKYTDGITEHIMPAPLSEKEINKVKSLAVKAHKALQCHALSRADFRYDGNEFYILEVNTHPGMTELSLVPEIANYVGINFRDLIEILVKKAKYHNS